MVKQGFRGAYAPRLRNGIALQGNAPSACPRNGAPLQGSAPSLHCIPLNTSKSRSDSVHDPYATESLRVPSLAGMQAQTVTHAARNSCFTMPSEFPATLASRKKTIDSIVTLWVRIGITDTPSTLGEILPARPGRFPDEPSFGPAGSDTTIRISGFNSGMDYRDDGHGDSGCRRHRGHDHGDWEHHHDPCLAGLPENCTRRGFLPVSSRRG